MYLVQGPKDNWGVGATEEEAIKNCAIEWGKNAEHPKFRYIVFLVDDERAYVDDNGEIVHSKESTVVEVRRKGL